MSSIKRAKPVHKPWHPAPWEPEDATSIKALAAGVANEGQQRRALKWIIDNVCENYDMPWFPGVEGERDTDFANGKRFVSLQIVKLINLPAALMERKPNE